MRIRTQRVAKAACLALVCGCATTGSSQAESGATGAQARASATSSEVRALHERQAQQAARIQELEARLALLEAESSRERSESEPVRTSSAVRIGASREAPARDHRVEVGAEEQPPVAATRPRLRLYGRQNTAAKASELPPVPIVAETLPVAPLPAQRSIPASEQTASPRAPELGRYLEGLRLLRERHFDDAIAAFDRFVESHRGHELVSSAMYWRGEAQYAKRDYEQARQAFEALLTRFPQSEKAADSLLKLALCFRQLGSDEQARGALNRLRTEYPKSQAAAIAAREGAT